MAKYNREERRYRTELLRHLHQMHGFTVPPALPRALGISELEEIHSDAHLDGYACPPHTHVDPTDLNLGEINFTLGKRYFEKMLAEIMS